MAGSAFGAKDMSLAVTLFSNLGAVSLKLEDPHQALHYTEKALRFDAAHVSKMHLEQGLGLGFRV